MASSRKNANAKRQTARAISTIEWGTHKDDFIKLYVEKDMPLHKCMEAMERDYGFIANRRQYLRKIRDWNIDKNIKGGEMRVALRKVLERWVKEGKDTRVEIRGVEVTKDQIKRFLRREASKSSHTTIEGIAVHSRIKHHQQPETLNLRPSWKLPTPPPACYKIYTPAASVKGLYTPNFQNSHFAKMYSNVGTFHETKARPNSFYEIQPHLSTDRISNKASLGSLTPDTDTAVILSNEIEGVDPINGEIICIQSSSGFLRWYDTANHLSNQYRSYLSNYNIRVPFAEEYKCHQILELVAISCVKFIREFPPPYDHAIIVQCQSAVNEDSFIRKDTLQWCLKSLHFSGSHTCPNCYAKIPTRGDLEQRVFRLPPGMPFFDPTFSSASWCALRYVYRNNILVTATKPCQPMILGHQHYLQGPYLSTIKITGPPDCDYISDGDFAFHESENNIACWHPSIYPKKALADHFNFTRALDQDLEFIFDLSSDLNIESSPEFDADEFMSWLDGNQIKDVEMMENLTGAHLKVEIPSDLTRKTPNFPTGAGPEVEKSTGEENSMYIMWDRIFELPGIE
ncbi:hypothetical protein TWF694_001962 [Orbilia ellipsospora]|uniref:Clr5 domain-containing protein n=1 Tax=Orbilia ellipsospora TaxID=2528407 RepID=A0AAV9X5G4_9PEZI